ncbi:MAG TPA: hypothetical protein VK856_12165 [Anaerolineaceae bacterium]|nr:hypothetical protein [Anaerolineaceae bacterium]
MDHTEILEVVKAATLSRKDQQWDAAVAVNFQLHILTEVWAPP